MKLRIGVVVFVAIAATSGIVALARSTTHIRYCCTPQQVQACAATGGTTTCRAGVCLCQF
jgi:hypothetical protein